jgi:hypothetical protein
MSLMMVADKLKELLQSPSPAGTKLPRLLTDASASTRTMEALHHFHKAPAFATGSEAPIRIVMGKVVELAFKVCPQPFIHSLSKPPYPISASHTIHQQR